MSNRRPVFGVLHDRLLESLLAHFDDLPKDRYRIVSTPGGFTVWEVGDRRCTGRRLFFVFDDCEIDWSAMTFEGISALGDVTAAKFADAFGEDWRKSLKGRT